MVDELKQATTTGSPTCVFMHMAENTFNDFHKVADQVLRCPEVYFFPVHETEDICVASINSPGTYLILKVELPASPDISLAKASDALCLISSCGQELQLLDAWYHKTKEVVKTVMDGKLSAV